jgi:hypothetical protein
VVPANGQVAGFMNGDQAAMLRQLTLELQAGRQWPLPGFPGVAIARL